MDLARLIFGEDIFISYSRGDAVAYTASLANLLSARGFACFLDQWGSEPGKEIPRRVLRALRGSSMLVVVGSPRAAGSQAVRREVEAFLATARPIVPISIDGGLERSEWFALIAGASLSAESAARLEDGTPSEHVLTRIESSFRFTKRNARVRRGFLAAVIGLLLLIAVAAWRQFAATVATQRATRAQAEAAKARGEATTAARQANEQAKRARESAAEAKRQEGAAIQSAQRALQQQKLAEERTRRARSLELAAASRAVLDTEPDLGALLAVESFAAADVSETRRALLSALLQRPLLETVLIGPQEGRAISKGRYNTGQVEALAFSADGKRIAAREWDGAISVWDVSGSRRAREVIGAGDQVRQEAISTDFKLVTRQLRHLYGDPDEMAISPDRTLIATGTADGIVRLWNARDKTPIGEPLTQSNLKQGEKSGDIAVVYPVTLLWFSPDGKILHWRTSESKWGTIDVATRQPATWLPEDFPALAAFSGDGASVAFVKGDGSAGSGRLYKGKLEAVQKLNDVTSVSAVAMSADGMLIAAGTRDGTLVLFDRTASVSPSIRIKAHAGTINALAFSPDGSHLVSGGDDRTVLLWRTRHGSLYQRVSGIEVRSRGMQFGATARFTPNGQRLLVTTGDSILVIDPIRATQDGAPIQCSGSQLSALAIHPDGTTVAAGSERHQLFFANLAGRRCAERPRSPMMYRNLSLVTALAFSPGGQFLASGDTEGTLAVWSVASQLRGKYLRNPAGDSERINSIVWLRGRALAVGSTIVDRLWPAYGSKNVVALQTDGKRSRLTAISGDGRLLAGSSRQGVHLWDAASGREIARFALEKPAHDVDEDTVTALALDHRGRLLAVGQENGRLSLFDLVEEKWMGDLPVPPGCYGDSCAALSLDFSPSGDGLAAVVGENILIWRLDPRLWVQQARQLANRIFTDAERRRYVSRE